ncbi:hypothetical protein BDV32DRAFT_154757 [Aspergillus pseudonomiae]|uniref:Uncharacterized protein n=1 Tax=Aspergillus pseudonomiae TaxID=1506151 RepID=A0A5N7DBX3_9EURO|nr:uncharacterized protein BDV37DRAFT_283413 [Aspergillus pseudonomiae]KAB8254953.1 hypothetical protein BDV32DRAFT_154757 [Aspergillus pseudonomiae]KAE8403729.1 hypothetical protein BDV37DRAFT_283413 [Aspergillus pseudonomiae]
MPLRLLCTTSEAQHALPLDPSACPRTMNIPLQCGSGGYLYSPQVAMVVPPSLPSDLKASSRNARLWNCDTGEPIYSGQLMTIRTRDPEVIPPPIILSFILYQDMGDCCCHSRKEDKQYSQKAYHLQPSLYRL